MRKLLMVVIMLVSIVGCSDTKHIGNALTPKAINDGIELCKANQLVAVIRYKGNFGNIPYVVYCTIPGQAGIAEHQCTYDVNAQYFSSKTVYTPIFKETK